MSNSNTFDSIRIGIASPEDILRWTYRPGMSGDPEQDRNFDAEVKKPETINYRTFKPERDGLFCERIFGPVKDWECACGRYKKIKYKGMVCERCGVEVTRSKVRRERMGYIRLAAPVSHIWYLKNVPSPIGLLLDISPKALEKVVYFSSFIVIDIDSERISELLPRIQEAVEREKCRIQSEIRRLEEDALRRFAKELDENADEYDEQYVRERTKMVNDRIRAEYRDADDRLKDMDGAVKTLGELKKNELIEEDKYRAVVRMLDAVGNQFGEDLRPLVRAGIGAEAIKELLVRIDLERLSRELRLEIRSTSSQRRTRAIKRLEVVEALRASRSRPEWMILDVIPVISPELRPMVQLDGGRFATSDLNDLYRRIINRNNRLKKIMEIHAPESIINHEKRLLQEAVDALIDNGRRSRPVVGSNARPLKSLSDMLKGKEGRFRKNLLGKRVDYSGRSVIVVGPHLKLHQCGLPKEMALELFKPFVMKVLTDSKATTNIKTAKRMVERMHPAVWDALEQVIREHPVLLNRAPTLHRLGIQAFEPVLVDGKAIQVHPLVCHAYNADFDGDQMAVHVPLSTEAQAEARVLMLSTQNLFSPADGRPTVSPIQDIVLGGYALTFVSREGQRRLEEIERLHAEDPERHPAPRVYSGLEEVLYLLESPSVAERLALNDPVKVRIRRPKFRPDSEIDYRDPDTGIEYRYETIAEGTEEERRELVPLEQEFETVVVTATPGQLIFNDILPYPLRFSDEFLRYVLSKKAMQEVIVQCHKRVGVARTIRLLDDLKELGFRWATKYGLTVAITDMDPPARREELLRKAEEDSNRYMTAYRTGRTSYKEMTDHMRKLWSDTTEKVGEEIVKGLDQFNPLFIITDSGARGNVKQLTQLAGMRGLMLNQFNEIIYELPIKNSFHRGLSMLEFFVTTHGARKGLADTALRTADAGYLTRRLVDVAQDVIVRAVDCGTLEGVAVHRVIAEGDTIEQIGDRLFGRVSLSTVMDPETGEVLFSTDEIITKEKAARISSIENGFYQKYQGADEKERSELAARYQEFGFGVTEHGLLTVTVRSPLTCELELGICSKCYGVDLSTDQLVEVGVAVGIIAAQSIGEPGTQLTMRTFHTGGTASGRQLAGTSQYKTGRFIRQFMEDFKSATDADESDLDPRKLLESQVRAVSKAYSRELLVTEEEPNKKKTERQAKAEKKLAEKVEAQSKKRWEQSRKSFFYAWTGESSGIVRVEEIFEARRQPRGKAIICPISGVVHSINESPFGRWVLILGQLPISTGPIQDAFVAEEQDWPIEPGTDPQLDRIIGQRLTTATLTVIRRHPEIQHVRVIYAINVPPYGELPIRQGGRVVKGDPLTYGPLDPHEVLELAGAAEVYNYFIQNLQGVYKAQGVDINDKHIEVIIRQMLRKRQVRDPGDSAFLPGQIVDRFVLQRENRRLRLLNEQGVKLKYTDPETGEEIEREYREATAQWVLLGISDASLATDSFLSAASFQKTTKVLTEAAVRGKMDPLTGLKENVIIGRLIPSGTGVQRYREIEVQVGRGPEWTEQPLVELARRHDEDSELSSDMPSMGSIKEMANRVAQEDAESEGAV
ncbi:MAG: DNA-directed RNA polymerase subunit beta' [Fimbriimonadales bacterium]|nr:DNA-directed RNA polymerase subunit beta' [Fimbriimonadales bacterium]